MVDNTANSTVKSQSFATGLRARFERRESFWAPLYFGLPNFLVDVEIPRNDHLTVVTGEHFFQELFGR